MMDRFTVEGRLTLIRANKEALQRKHAQVDTEHLLLAVLHDKDVTASLLRELRLSADAIHSEVEALIKPGPRGRRSGILPFTPLANQVLELADRERTEFGHDRIGPEHLLLGLATAGRGHAFEVLHKFGLNIDLLRYGFLTATSQGPDTANDAKLQAREETPTLDKYCRNLTLLASKKSLDPLIGREVEIDKTLQVLCRKKKNNPVLVGDSGVGKTAIVEGLAQQIVAGQVPPNLRNIEILEPDLALLVAGTMYRGQFEDRFKRLLEEVRNSGRVVLFIDELHTLLGAGSAEGTIDAAHMLKPVLTQGAIKCIGATTFHEYRKYIEKDTALERRFRIIKVPPPSLKETVEILGGLRERYEAHHRVTYADESLEAAARLSERYITGRSLPDKAIDLMDEAGARAQMDMAKAPLCVSVQEQGPASVKSPDLPTPGKDPAGGAEDHPSQEHGPGDTSAFTPTQPVGMAWPEKHTVGREEIEQVVAQWTGIPIARLKHDECQQLLGLEDRLKEVVVGQEEAVTGLARVLRRSRAGIKDPSRPLGSFLFVGPTGVGKTLLAQALAECVLGTRHALIQIDMSEYQEKHTVSRLIGAPPGYVGHEEGGQLTESVRQRPYSVVLLDEIEKAHPDVSHILLQVLEEGTLTDSLGRKADFRNAIILTTSNAGTGKLGKQMAVGFVSPSDTTSGEEAKTCLLEEVRRAFKPELLNRLDDIITFDPLSEEDCRRIVLLEIGKLRERLEQNRMDLDLDITEEALELLVERGFDPWWGARPLKRAIQRLLEDPLAEGIISGKFHPGRTIRVAREEDVLSLEPIKICEPDKVPV